MSIDIELIKKLAGLLNMNSVVANDMPVASEPEQSASCGCEAETSGSNMRKFMDATTFEEIEEEDEDEDGEWANSTDHFDGKRRDHGQPTGAVVDTSLRRHLGAKAMPVRIEESDENSEEDEEDEEKSVEEELEEAFVNEGIKDKLKIAALLGITAMGGDYAVDSISPANSPLGKALSQAASQGDEEAAQYLKRLGAIIDANDTSTLKMLNFTYLDEPAAMHTNESMMESYKRHKDRTKERQKQRIKNKAKDKVIATVGGGNLKGMASVEESEQEIEKYNVVNTKTKTVVGSAKTRQRARNILDKKDNEYGSYAHSIVPVYKKSVEEATIHTDFEDKLTPTPNKKAYAVDKAGETKKKVSLAPEPWKNKKETKEMVKESVDLLKLKKNAGLL